MSSTNPNSTVSFTLADSPTPTPTSSGHDSNNNRQAPNRGANYFFGFLITFIALLLLFIGCGIGTRRRLQRRRGLLDLGVWGDTQSVIAAQEEPQFLEPKFVKFVGGTWSSIQPLSTSLISFQSSPESEETKKVPSRPDPPTRMPSPNPIAYHGLSLPVWSSTARASKSEGEESPRLTSDLMQVAVMISMPSTSHVENISPDDEQPLPEYQLGVARIPWEHGRTLFT
ncbi:hypothetical protein Moror_3101 [Moniliophthora roreri MCA 2997]|uniref:Uncharacterized protein n=1 Tax=Moniliophthora roreri (strain MCA 2997) TaxID=1381753 RepID=V2WP24_MONRO|nr:hypothetical protein Moror_3101 [Moniliophthora roreri MCA 2997]